MRYLLGQARVVIEDVDLVAEGRMTAEGPQPLPADAGRRTLFRLNGSALHVTEAEAEVDAAAATGEDLRPALDELIDARDDVTGRLLGGDAGARQGHAPADLGGYC